MLDNESLLKWLAKSVGYKRYSFKYFLNTRTRKDRKSNLINHREIYEFWIQNSIIFNDSANSTKTPQIQQPVRREKLWKVVLRLWS